MSKALLLTGGSEAFETSLFIGKVDKFFDALNVTSYTKGLKARKSFQKPYVSKDDFRLQVCTCINHASVSIMHILTVSY